MAYIGKQPTIGNFVKLDSITTSATTTFNLTNGGVAYSPQSPNHCIVSLNGVIQSPNTSFTISGSTIVFASALTSSDVIDFILVLGDVLNIGTPSDATVTNAKLALTAGSASTPTISIATDTNTGMFFPAADTIAFTEGGTEAMRINSDGNIGIGTTNPSQKISIARTATTTVTNASYYLGLGAGENLVDSKRLIGMGYSDGALDEYPSAMGFVETNNGGYTNGAIVFYTRNVTTNTAPSERMRIDSAGNFKASRNGVAYNTNSAHQFVDDGANNYSLMIANKSASPASQYMLEVAFKSASPDNNSARFIQCEDSTTARMTVMSDGDLQNHDNSYGAISDERIKQDIRDSNSQWNDIKNIKVRNYKKKDDVRQYGENAKEQIGVIAQELETVSPKLIEHSDPTPSDILSNASFGTLYEEGDEIPEGKKIGDVKEIYEQVKSVSYSVLYMKAIKALQEAMERIETLEAKVTTLENN